MLTQRNIDETTIELLIEPQADLDYYVMPIEGLEFYIIIRINDNILDMYDTLQGWYPASNPLEFDICDLAIRTIDPIEKPTRIITSVFPERIAMFTVMVTRDQNEKLVCSPLYFIKWSKDYLEQCGFNGKNSSIMEIVLSNGKTYFLSKNADVLEGFLTGLNYVG
jgi:hypothetical protein